MSSFFTLFDCDCLNGEVVECLCENFLTHPDMKKFGKNSYGFVSFYMLIVDDMILFDEDGSYSDSLDDWWLTEFEIGAFTNVLTQCSCYWLMNWLKNFCPKNLGENLWGKCSFLLVIACKRKESEANQTFHFFPFLICLVVINFWHRNTVKHDFAFKAPNYIHEWHFEQRKEKLTFCILIPLEYGYHLCSVLFPFNIILSTK